MAVDPDGEALQGKAQSRSRGTDEAAFEAALKSGFAATVIAVPIGMMTRSCGPPGKLDDAAAQTAAEAAHAGQNGGHLSIFLDETALPRSFQRAAHFSRRFH